MKFYKDIFTGKSIDNKEQIIDMIKSGISVLNIYLICIDVNSKNLMETFQCNEIFKDINKNKSYIIIGIAKGRKEAFELVKYIFEFWYINNHNFDKIKTAFC